MLIYAASDGSASGPPGKMSYMDFGKDAPIRIMLIPRCVGFIVRAGSEPRAEIHLCAPAEEAVFLPGAAACCPSGRADGPLYCVE